MHLPDEERALMWRAFEALDQLFNCWEKRSPPWSMPFVTLRYAVEQARSVLLSHLAVKPSCPAATVEPPSP